MKTIGELLVKPNMLALMQATDYGKTYFPREELIKLALQFGHKTGADKKSLDIILDLPLKDFLT